MAKSVDMKVVNAPVVTKWLTELGTAAPARAAFATTQALNLIRNGLQAELEDSTGSGVHWLGLPHPSSAAGDVPARQSGDYAKSWYVIPAAVGTTSSLNTKKKTLTTGTTVGGEVATDAAQARRLELGFVGTDSAGRTYNQAPRPHVDQVVERIVPIWVARILAMQE